MKSTASQILFGIEAFSGAVDQDLDYAERQSRCSLKDKHSNDGFICYIDSDLTPEKTLELNDSVMKSNKDDPSTKAGQKENIYASVDMLKKTRAMQVLHPCPLCREISKIKGQKITYNAV